MMRIWKYPLAIVDHQQLTVPRGAKCISLAAQDDTPVLYFAFPKDSADVMFVAVSIIGTGHEFSDDLKYYVGSTATHDGKLMWHIFVRPIGSEIN